MNPVLAAVADHWVHVAVWGLIATAIMTTVLEGAQLLGYTRLSLPFLFGTFVTGNRAWAIILGFVLYLIGGWLFAALYAVVFETLGRSDWWLGLALGAAHGLFLVAVFLPMLPYVHPRIASEYSGPSPRQRLHPPGAFGLHYGRGTPISTVVGQTVYGVVMALGYP